VQDLTHMHGGARPGAGRPKLPVQERRRRAVKLSLTGDEYKALRQAARGRPVAAFIRQLAFDALWAPPCA